MKITLREWKRETVIGTVDMDCAPLIGWRFEVHNGLGDRAIYVVKDTPTVQLTASPGSLDLYAVHVSVQRLK